MEATQLATFFTFSPVSTLTIPSQEAQKFLTPLNIFLIIIGVAGFFSNFLPLYVIFTRRGRLTSGRRQSRDVLLAALSVVNILTVVIPLPIFVVKYNTNISTGSSWELGRPTICEMFHLSFVWLKLASLFIITTLNYTSYLTMTSSRDDRYSSISDQISDSFSCSRSNARGFYQRQRRWSIANLVIGIALVSFLIASLPYLGLGPEGPDSKFTVKGKHLCSLEQISYPKKEKEYTFLFAVLMSTSACLLLHTVHSIVNCSGCYFKSSAGTGIVDGGSTSFVTSVESRAWCHQVNKSYARMISLLGLLFYITWVPVMIAVGSLMSAYRITDRFTEYVVAVAFVNPCLGPLLNGIFLVKYREGYMDLARIVFSLISSIKECRVLAIKTNRESVPPSTTQAVTGEPV